MVVRTQGTVLKMNGTAIGQRVSVGSPGADVNKRETTDLDSPIKAYRPGLPDVGDLALALHYDPADTTHTLLRDRVYAPLRGVAADDDAFELVFADGDPLANPVVAPSKATFKGFVSSFKPGDAGVDGNLTASVTITVTSVPVFTARA
jgi:hypothetical protein